MAPPFTVPCEGREARFLLRPHRESNPGSLRSSPLYNRCATPAPLGQKRFTQNNVISQMSLLINFLCNPWQSHEIFLKKTRHAIYNI